MLVKGATVSKRGHKRNKLKKNLKSNIILQYKFVDPFWGWLKLLSPKPMMPNMKVITGWHRYPSVNYATIGSDNGLSPGQCQVIIWTNAGILLIGPLGTNFGEILIEIHTFSFKKMHLKISSAKWRPFCLGLNVLTYLQKSSNDENPEDWEQAEKTQRTQDIKSFNYLAHGRYSISQEICTRFCCALLCCGYAIVHNEFTWSIYPYSSGLLCWHWGNR